MNRRNIQANASGSIEAKWDPSEPTFPPGPHQGTLTIDGGPPVPVSYAAAYVRRRRLRVLDINWPRLCWLTVFWRGFADGGRPALEISLWRPSRRSWLHVWQWEDDPEHSGMEVTIQATPQQSKAEGEKFPPPSECPGCREMGMAGLWGECIEPGCNVIH
jgi:hypothetical protein